MDGVAPSEIQRRSQADALKYPTIELCEDAVESVTGARDAFVVKTALGRSVQARRVILAHGNRDILPEIPGLQEGWGRTVLQCPYCHGYEVADRQTAVLMCGAPSLHQIRLLPDWSSDLTLFTNGMVLEDEERATLQRLGIAIEGAGVASLAYEGDRLLGLNLSDGRRADAAVLYVVTQSAFNAPFAEQLGCVIEEGPVGPYILAEPTQETSVPGVYAAGDISAPFYSAVNAAASGARAGSAAHQSLRM